MAVTSIRNIRIRFVNMQEKKMADIKLARRYAKSLLDLALERNIVDKVYGDMQLVSNTITANRDLALLLKNPIVNTDKKNNIISALFSTKIDAVTMAFFNIITRKGRESYLEEIAKSFIDLYKTNKGIRIAHITTAITLDAATRERIITIVKQTKGNQLELVEKVDKDLIGGFILRVGDEQVDTSISKELRNLKSEFDDNLYIKEY